MASLERDLGVVLFHRTSRGISLTVDGERYYEVSRQVAADLGEVELRLGRAGAKPRGTLTVVMRAGVGQYCVMPHIARFMARYPDIELVVKQVEIIAELDRQDFDLAVMTGWPPEWDFVVRALAQTRNVVCASPEYWRRAGMPQTPEALSSHHCLVFRSAGVGCDGATRMVRPRTGQTIDVRGSTSQRGQAICSNPAASRVRGTTRSEVTGPANGGVSATELGTD